MSIENFYQYTILRDILGYILPGGISLAGLAILIQAINQHLWNELVSLSSRFQTWFLVAILIVVAFLLGHILDMLYRKLFQGRGWYTRPGTVRKVLTGSEALSEKLDLDPVANEIRRAVGEFLNIDWEETKIEEWISSERAFRAISTLGYWIQHKNPQLFNTEVARPIIQSHFLHASGLSFLFLGVCAILAMLVSWMGVFSTQILDSSILVQVALAACSFGYLLILQGRHKRNDVIDHILRVFYVMWHDLQEKQDERGGKTILIVGRGGDALTRASTRRGHRRCNRR